MRHGKTHNHLGRTAAHRHALLSNMASSLILHKRITTTVAKAKELRKYVEPLITKAKNDTTHSRRTVFSYLQNKDSVKELFGDVAEKIANRPGGYTRILKLGNRLGDNADVCIIELVDYNETMLAAKSATAKTKTRRSRRGSGAKGASSTPSAGTENQITSESESTEDSQDS
jgi:large subunit ribosomal protein L17